MRRVVLASLLVGALSAPVFANGRPAATSTIHFRQGHPEDIVAGLTFGLVVSHDSGATWHLMCEAAVGYGGLYDPAYAYSQSGAMFATTFDGLKVNRDGCTFDATPPGTTFASQVYLGPDHALYYAAADPADAKIYKSTDDGATFPTSASPGMNNDWWESIIAAPSDASRVYLSGYRLPSGMPKQFLLFESTNGGTSFAPMTTSGMTTSTNSAIDLVGVSPDHPDVLFAIVTLENGATPSDGLYKSIDAGQTWTKILGEADSLHFVARADGTCVAATQTLGAWVSTDCDSPTSATATWADLTNPPHINCLVENSLGEVWACTQNYGALGNGQSDGFGIMKTTDLATWTGVLKYQDIADPVACAAGTVQYDTCQLTVWCTLKQQLGITSTAVACAAVGDNSFADDAGNGSGSQTPKGCCDTSGGGAPAALVFGTLLALVLLRRRHRR